MGEFVKNVIVSILSGFGGVASLFLLFKHIIKNSIEEFIKNQMDKSLALFEQRINRQDSVFNIRIQKEFAFYDRIQIQNSIIKGTVTESIICLLDEDKNRFCSLQNELRQVLKEVSEILESNRAYINSNLLSAIYKIEKSLKELLQKDCQCIDYTDLYKQQYEKKAKEIVTLVIDFNKQLRDYIAKISNTSEQ